MLVKFEFQIDNEYIFSISHAIFGTYTKNIGIIWNNNQPALCILSGNPASKKAGRKRRREEV